MGDLVSESYILILVVDFYESNRPIAMVCHAPAILRDVKLINGKFLVEGKNLTGFKDSEDAEIELDIHLPFSLEQDLQLRGANYKSVANWAPNVVLDGALMTGQSPASAAPLAEALRDRLKK